MDTNESVEPEIAQTERIGLGDLFIVGLVAVATFFLARQWEFPGLYPGVWNDAAVAAGTRPASSVVPGYWTAFATFIHSFYGVAKGATLMRLLGHVCLAGLAVMVYGVLREWLAFAMRMRPQLSRRRTAVMRIASVLGAAAFVAADPVWTTGQCLSETSILLVLTLGSLECFFVFLRKGTIKYAYLASLLLGLLAAETPFGLVLPVLLVSIIIFIAKCMPDLESPFFEPAVMEVGKWHMTFIFLAALVLGIALNSWTYLSHSGAVAIGATGGDVPLTYLLNYWHRLADAGDFAAWLMWCGVCLLPFVVATIKFPESADEEQFLTYASGLIFFFCGLVVLAQSSFLPALWFWTYFPMNSQFLLTVGLFCSAATLALSMTILGVDALCRDHQRLAIQTFGNPGEDDEMIDALEDEDAGIRRRVPRRAPHPVGASRSTAFFRRLGMIVIPIFILAVMVPGRVMKTTREMLALMNDVIAEIVREVGDAKYLFTDGNLDCALELKAAERGVPFKCFSLMSSEDKLAVHLRLRGLKDADDIFSFKFDTAMGLRSWIRDKPARLAESAALMGFDLWKRDGKALPPMGGLLSLLAGFPNEAERVRGVRAAHDLANRVLALHRQPGGIKDCNDPLIRQKFYQIQWRLARMCFYRSEADDVKGRVDEAIAEVTLSKALNDFNETYQNLIESMERRNAQMMQTLTPREGLQLALVRADFRIGKTYAETILGADPENPDANFAMGMFYLKEHQLSRAERYLTRCLIRKPDEPAIYNNLAMIQIELRKFEAARINVEKALKLIPNSTAVLDTKKALEAAMKGL